MHFVLLKPFPYTYCIVCTGSVYIEPLAFINTLSEFVPNVVLVVFVHNQIVLFRKHILFPWLRI